jgi:hypothetical protein
LPTDVGPFVPQRRTIYELKLAKEILIHYYEVQHRFPTTEEGLDVIINFDCEKYLCISMYPRDGWQQKIGYSSDGKSFKLYSYGADRKSGGILWNKDLIITYP